jgi:chromosomal replication initiator protein
LEERLRSRFEWGLTADIQAPDFETRLAILRSKAERTGRHISDEILESVAKQIQSNIRELEGALNRIIAFADLSGSVLTPSLVEIALADLLPSRSDLEPAHVVDLVARKFNLTAEKLLGRDRTKEVAYPRQIAMYLLREEAKISFPQIGEALGGRDHSTVMSAIDKVKDQYKNGDGRVRKDIDFLRHQLYDKTIAA